LIFKVEGHPSTALRAGSFSRVEQRVIKVGFSPLPWLKPSVAASEFAGLKPGASTLERAFIPQSSMGQRLPPVPVTPVDKVTILPLARLAGVPAESSLLQCESRRFSTIRGDNAEDVEAAGWLAIAGQAAKVTPCDGNNVALLVWRDGS